VGKINDKNMQYRMAFQDEDLRKPAHDDIMCWLDDWAKNTENVSRFFNDSRKRTRNTYHRLSASSKDMVELSPNKLSIYQQFESDFKNQYSSVESHEDEPAMSIAYASRQWEALLHAHDENYGRKQFMGFCDLAATYEVTMETEHRTVHYKNIESIEPDTENKYCKKWKFCEGETKSGYADRSVAIELFLK
jgi:hypothetical protein